MTMTGSLFRCSLLVLSLLFSACSMVGSSRSIVIQGATLIDGTGRAAIADSVVVIRDGKFAAVGKRGEVAIPQGAEADRRQGQNASARLDRRPLPLPRLDGRTLSRLRRGHLPEYLE